MLDLKFTDGQITKFQCHFGWRCRCRCWMSRLMPRLPSHVTPINFRPNSLHALSWTSICCIHHISSQYRSARWSQKRSLLPEPPSPMRHCFLVPTLVTWRCTVAMASRSYLSLKDVEFKVVGSPGCPSRFEFLTFFNCSVHRELVLMKSCF